MTMRINPLENGILMVRSSATEYWGKIFADAELLKDSIIRKFRITNLAVRFIANQTGAN